MDATEDIRRNMVESGQPFADLEASEGQKWTTDELTRDLRFWALRRLSLWFGAARTVSKALWNSRIILAFTSTSNLPKPTGESLLEIPLC